MNPHDIVLYPAWRGRRSPLKSSPLDPPNVPESPTDHEDLSSQAVRAGRVPRGVLPSGYGPPAAIERIYRKGAQAYRNLYYRLHAEVDRPLERVRRYIDMNSSPGTPSSCGPPITASCSGPTADSTRSGSTSTTRPPASRSSSQESVASRPTSSRTVTSPTSHVDLVPTLLAAAGIDEAGIGRRLRADFSEVHPLPGRNLMPIVDGASVTEVAKRAVYLLTRDNMLEGDSGASGLARRLRRKANPPVAAEDPGGGPHRLRSFEGGRRQGRRQ